MVRIFGRSRRSRWLRSGIGIFACTAIIALVAIPSALAVHDLGIFQLDGNAQTSVQSDPEADEDWDLICKANQAPSTGTGQCVFANDSLIPTGDTTADPHSFVVDPSQSQTDDILKGGTKDDNDVSSWKWASAKPSPPKNDITDAYAAEYEATNGDSVLYFGADRFSNNGSANIAFWFFQNEIKRNPETGECAAGAGCPFTGVHKAGNVSLGGSGGVGCSVNPPPGSTCIPGDILIISAFGPHATISVYEWVGAGNAINPPGPEGCFTSVCSLEPLVEGSAECGTNDNDNVCAIVNELATPSPWVVQQSSGPANQFLPTNFFEGGLNLSALNVDACFSSFLVNTRSSAAGDAELHDMVLGQFARCEPNLTTQASTNGTVTPGTAVTDRAIVQVTGADNPADPLGTVTFYLCGPIPTGGCESTTNQIGSAVNLTNAACDPASPNDIDGKRCAVSVTVNDSAQTGNRGPLAPGRYCFRAKATLTNYASPEEYTDATNECFTVAKIPTGTVTSPGTIVGTTFTPVTTVTIGTTVYDRAVVTGTAAGGDPTGQVNFFVCGPIAAPATCTTNGTADAGNPFTLVSDGNAATFTSSATSSGFTPTAVGRYCFRAEYGGSLIYNGSSDSSAGECFTVTSTSSMTSLQNWLPNDSVTLTSVGSVPLNGSLVITLRETTCNGTVKYTEPTFNSPAGGWSSGTVFNTTNGSVPATTFRVTAANIVTGGVYYWRAEFTSNDPFVAGFTKCEKSTLAIDNNPAS